MKKSELRKIIREVIKEQYGPGGNVYPGGDLGPYDFSDFAGNEFTMVGKCYVCVDSLPLNVQSALQGVGVNDLITIMSQGFTNLSPSLAQSPSFFGDFNNSDCFIPVGLSGKVLSNDLGLNPGGGAIMLGGSTSPLDCRKPSGVGPVSPRG